MLLQRVHGEFRFVRGTHVADQPPVARRVFADDHDRLADTGITKQDRFDLAELDPMAVDLHLVIEPAEEFDRPVRR